MIILITTVKPVMKSAFMIIEHGNYGTGECVKLLYCYIVMQLFTNSLTIRALIYNIF